MPSRERVPQKAAPSDFQSRLVGEIERLLGRTLESSWQPLGQALTALHARFVSEAPLEASQAGYLSGKHALAAYLAYFYPSSAAQVRRALAEVSLPERPVLRVLDLGSGPGPASAAIAERAGRKVEVTALEGTEQALDSMRRLWDPVWGTLETIEWRAGQPLPAGPFDVVVASHVLNELFLDESARLDHRAKLALELGQKLSPGGLLVLIEPALKRTARELLVVRDRLMPHGFSALAPCLFQGACPVIARPRDWCHADRPWEEPELVTKAGNAAGLRRDTLKFAYVVLSNSHPNAAVTRDSSLFRIVSEPLPEKGKLRFFGCGPTGRHPLVRLEKDAAAPNEPFATLQRGDIVRVQGLTASGDGKRLGPTSDVSLEARAVDRDRTP